jgi:hypothetical protein
LICPLFGQLGGKLLNEKLGHNNLPLGASVSVVQKNGYRPSRVEDGSAALASRSDGLDHMMRPQSKLAQARHATKLMHAMHEECK